MKLVEDRHGKRSTLFTTKKPVEDWHEVIGGQCFIGACLDCIAQKASAGSEGKLPSIVITEER